MITITSIGLGDIQVKTQAGYILSVLSMILGTFIISSILVVIINTIKMTHKES
jgi:ABC-type nickel/cobalt efflux system permease component RcnA